MGLNHFQALADQSILRIATTTSTKASGLIDILIPAFEKIGPYKIDLSIVSTGNALRMGRSGQVDVILVHAPDEEIKFVNDGYGLQRNPVMHNSFLLVGPSTNPAKINKNDKIEEGFKHIASSQQLFISRADDSGTHKKERTIWRKSRVDPYGQDWYFELGAGMSETLKVASQKSAYTLTDEGSWLALKDDLNLVSILEGDKFLQNPYHVIAINPQKNKAANFEAAQVFIKWLLSKEAQQLIADYRIKGKQLFTPYH
jgi:tungstate transport system substrate-binding protein